MLFIHIIRVSRCTSYTILNEIKFVNNVIVNFVNTNVCNKCIYIYSTIDYIYTYYIYTRKSTYTYRILCISFTKETKNTVSRHKIIYIYVSIQFLLYISKGI